MSHPISTRNSQAVLSMMVGVLAWLLPSSSMAGDDLEGARAELAAKGCFIRTDEAGNIITLSAGQARKLGDADVSLIARFPELRTLDLGHNEITDNGFRSLDSLRNLDSLHANATQITDASLGQIARWKHLRTLSLPDTVTDNGVRQLGGLVRLESFGASGPGVTDASIDTLLKFPNLKSLSLGGRITPAGVERLTALTEIEYVILWNLMDDSMMPIVAKFPKLKQLSLNATRVTEAGLPQLRNMENLYTLTLPKETTDAGLVHISTLRRLGQLDLRYTRVTNDGLAALKDLKALSMLTLPATTGDAAVTRLIEFQLPISSLNLIGPGYTDACIPELISMQGVSSFGLWKTNITADGFKQLQQARPKVQLSR